MAAPARAYDEEVEYWPPRRKPPHVSIDHARRYVSREPRGPVVVVIDVTQQKLTAFDREGPFASAPVSSGRQDYETPEGVFSIIEKQEEHYSNLYDDAAMPYMQRLTWSGVALHQGALPGYPASHGCVRLPGGFAEWLFRQTRLNTRVVVSPYHSTLFTIAHRALPDSLPVPGAGERRAELTPAPVEQPPSSISSPDIRRARSEAHVRADAAKSRLAEAAAASEKARVHAKKLREVAEDAERAFRAAFKVLTRADESATAASAAHERARGGRWQERAKAALDAAEKRLAEATRAADDAETRALDTAAEARTAAAEAHEAETARLAALDASRAATRAALPVSVLISRKKGRIYIRQGFAPVADLPVTITDPQKAIGTHVFTSMGDAPDGGAMVWTGVTVDDPALPPIRHQGRKRKQQTVSPTRDLAMAALDRVQLPPEVIARIAPSLQPGSTIMISDHGPSAETGKGTDFVLLTNPEPVWIEER